jgi:hypothetical protein
MHLSDASEGSRVMHFYVKTQELREQSASLSKYNIGNNFAVVVQGLPYHNAI